MKIGIVFYTDVAKALFTDDEVNDNWSKYSNSITVMQNFKKKFNRSFASNVPTPLLSCLFPHLTLYIGFLFKMPKTIQIHSYGVKHQVCITKLSNGSRKYGTNYSEHKLKIITSVRKCKRLGCKNANTRK